MTAIINLTQHVATQDQVEAGVVCIDYANDGDLNVAMPMTPRDREVDSSRIKWLLNFTYIPTRSELKDRAESIALIARQYNCAKAMIGGAPFFMPYLEKALWAVGIQPVYAFSERVVVEKTDDATGRVTKTAVFKHVGFVETYAE